MRTVFALASVLILATALPGCTQFPELDTSVSDATRAQPYPDLIPLDGLQARLASTRITPETGPSVEARITRLKARATHLRGTVIDENTRARMQADVAL